MGARFVLLIVLCTIFHNTQSLLIQYTYPEWSSVFSQFLLPKIANFSAWYKEYKGEGKPDLDKLKISEKDKPMNLETYEFSMYSNISLTIKDSNLMNFGAKLHPLQVWIDRQWGRDWLAIQYVAVNVSYTGNFSSTGTLLNETISFDGEGQFDMKIHILCTASVELKIGTEIPVKVSNQGAGAHALCNVSGTGPTTFSGILKNASPKIKESNRAGMERLLSSSLGTQVVQAALSRVMETKRKMMTGIFLKQVEDALKDVTIFDVINEWKPKYVDSVYGKKGSNGKGGHYRR